MTLSGLTSKLVLEVLSDVLIPLLVDDPLWAIWDCILTKKNKKVLIPLLVDDPLWVLD